jgi:hypothetical protein
MITIKDVDLIYSYYIRLRDADESGYCHCITCNRSVYFYNIDNGHHIKRQWHSHRFNDINCNAQCKACNNWGQGRDVEYQAAIIIKHGEDAVNLMLSKPKNRRKPKVYELEAIAKEHIPKVKLLLEQKCFELDIKEKIIKNLDRIERKLK